MPLLPALGLHFRLASVNHFETLCLHLIALPEEEKRNHSLFIQQISIKHLQHIRNILETGVTKPLPSWNFYSHEGNSSREWLRGSLGENKSAISDRETSVHVLGGRYAKSET